MIVRGRVFDVTAGKLTATTLRKADTDRDDQAEGGMVEEEGLITRFASATDFDVAGEKVTTTASTVFKNGTAADLALNVRVEVRGTLDANKVLVADVVEIERIAVIGLAATVSAVTTNTLTVLGVTISVDTNTRLEDVSNAHVHMFSLADVKVGDTVLVLGYENPAGSGMVLATRLVRLPPLPMMNVGVRGPFTATTALWPSRSRRIKSTRPGSDGKFSIKDLPAGTYLVAALTDVEPSDLDDPKFLEQVVPAGLRVTIASGEKKTQDLRIAR